MTAVYLVVGGVELGWKYSRMAAATALGLLLAANCMGALICQRYVAEVEDGCTGAASSQARAQSSCSRSSSCSSAAS